MTETLRNYFPMLPTKEKLLQEINERKELKAVYDLWEKKHQKEFLDMCTGAKGVKILYDAFFKEIFNPENTPERLDRLLSLLLGQKVRVRAVLQPDGARIAEQSALLTFDIVVELSDRSLANVECQKIGYAFPGQRSACYSSDLLLRQYKRVRGERGRAFSYTEIKNVYTIVFFEHSPAEFKKYPDTYLHTFRQMSDTGIEVNLLQKYLFIPLDIFRRILHNKGIRSDLEAWLAFLCEDDPGMIMKLLERNPEFAAMYEQIYGICRNVEDVMGIFSEELAILDKNTERLMIDQLQDEVNQQKEQLNQQKEKLNQKDEQLSQKDEQLARQQEEIRRLKQQLEEKRNKG